MDDTDKRKEVGSICSETNKVSHTTIFSESFQQRDLGWDLLWVGGDKTKWEDSPNVWKRKQAQRSGLKHDTANNEYSKFLLVLFKMPSSVSVLFPYPSGLFLITQLLRVLQPHLKKKNNVFKIAGADCGCSNRLDLQLHDRRL